MTSPLWMSLKRHVRLVWVVAILALCSTSAQSTTSSNSASPGPFPALESSSTEFELASDGTAPLPSLGALPAASAAAGGGQEAARGWRQKTFHSLAFEAGGGFNAPIGNDTSSNGGGPYITWGGNFNVGAGAHFSKRIGLLAEYQFIDDKLPGSLIAAVGTQGGNAHIWSLTLDPVIDLMPNRNNGVYVTGGGGFYRKLTSFTDPEQEVQCYYYCGIVIANATVYHFSSNQGGLNLGLGFDHRLGSVYGDSNAKVFVEARYLFLNTPKITETNGTGTTELLPVTLGLRW